MSTRACYASTQRADTVRINIIWKSYNACVFSFELGFRSSPTIVRILKSMRYLLHAFSHSALTSHTAYYCSRCKCDFIKMVCSLFMHTKHMHLKNSDCIRAWWMGLSNDETMIITKRIKIRYHKQQQWARTGTLAMTTLLTASQHAQSPLFSLV